MKPLALLIAVFAINACTHSQTTHYTGSTPADAEVRTFLGISMTDSIDFIRWKLTIDGKRYELDCEYGLSKANTNGFTDRQTVKIKSSVSNENHYIQLHHNKRTLNLLSVNSNILHIADQQKKLVAGNGGFSYVLNNTNPTKSEASYSPFPFTAPQRMMAFQGRTPCPGLSHLRNKTEGDVCYKLKWYVILYTDSLTGKPLYYLQGGLGYRKHTMKRGNWIIEKGRQGETIYVLDPEKGVAAARLWKASDNILFFIDGNGNPLIGNEDFSYTLNATIDREP